MPRGVTLAPNRTKDKLKNSYTSPHVHLWKNFQQPKQNHHQEDTKKRRNEISDQIKSTRNISQLGKHL